MESSIQVILMVMDGNKRKRNKILLMKNFGFLKEERSKTHLLTIKSTVLLGIHLLGFAE